jgi:predicted outer membrane repeat protein
LTLANSTISGNRTIGDGAGLYANAGAPVVVLSSTISANTAGINGGGIRLADAGLTIIGSLVYSNSAAADGGGLYASGTANLVLTNSTVSGNTAGDSGGGVYAAATTSLNNATVAFNTADSDADGTGDGGGLSGSVQVNARNTILARNHDESPVIKVPDCGLTLLSHGYNLIQNTNGCTIAGNTAGNITGVLPLMGLLRDNGGPTWTHALQSGSPAIDAGNPAGCTDSLFTPLTTDQRGQPRPVDGDGDSTATCDIGAYEWATLKLYLPDILR